MKSPLIVGMRVQCDACEGVGSMVVCCADEAALCARCDVAIHVANKLASKHQHLPLDAVLPTALPRCDVCEENTAFIFCVEDRALFCRDYDEPIHVPRMHSGNHQRYFATIIRVGFGSVCSANVGTHTDHLPSKGGSKLPSVVVTGGVPKWVPAAVQEVPSSLLLPSSGWAIEDLLQLSDYESSDKNESPLGFKELDWFMDIDVFHDHAPGKGGSTAPEVLELFTSPQPVSNMGFYKTSGARQSKKSRVELPDDDEDYLIVPDLG